MVDTPEKPTWRKDFVCEYCQMIGRAINKCFALHPWLRERDQVRKAMFDLKEKESIEHQNVRGDSKVVVP